jgi:hypothetical protein
VRKELVFQEFEPSVRFEFFAKAQCIARRLEHDSIVWQATAECYSRVSAEFVFSHWPMRDGTQWRPQRLAWTALLMAWDEGQTMQARFEHATQAGHELHPHWQLGETYSGFTAALGKQSPSLIAGLVRRFQQQLRALAGPAWQCRGWTAFAVDGTRIETPHTTANEQGLGCAGREKSAPQVFLTTLWHLGLGLPWDFRTGPGTDSERRHLEAMLAGLPTNSLIVADVGFCGYELCQRILQPGHSFLLRVGSNITLLTELFKVQQAGNLVYLWPQNFRDRPPLVLRLIRLTRDGQTMYLVTNVLDPAALSDADAAAFYEMRWGIEVCYRSYKQTLDRRTMNSRTPATCLLECQWTMLGLWLLGLLAVSRQLLRQRPPRRWSVARARDIVRRAVRHPARRCQRGTLDRELLDAVQDRYSRRGSKTARNYPRKKREKPPGHTAPNPHRDTTSDEIKTRCVNGVGWHGLPPRLLQCGRGDIAAE